MQTTSVPSDSSDSNSYNDLVIGFTCSFFAMFSFSISSMGDAIIFQIAYYLCGLLRLQDTAPLLDVIVYYIIASFPVAPIQSVILRKHIDWKLTLAMGIFNSSAIVLGIEILVRNDNIWLRRALGCTVFLFFVINNMTSSYLQHRQNTIIAESRRNEYEQQNLTHPNDTPLFELSSLPMGATPPAPSPPPPTQVVATTSRNDHSRRQDPAEMFEPKRFELDSCGSWTGLAFTAGLSGFMVGLFGVGGPPWFLWTLITRIEMNQFRASVCTGWTLFGRNVTLFYTLYVKQQFDKHAWPLYLISLVGGFFGLGIGNIAAKFVNQQRFRQWVQLLLVIGSMLLIVAGSVTGTYIVAGVTTLVFIGFSITLCRVSIRQRLLGSNDGTNDGIDDGRRRTTYNGKRAANSDAGSSAIDSSLIPLNNNDSTKLSSAIVVPSATSTHTSNDSHTHNHTLSPDYTDDANVTSASVVVVSDGVSDDQRS